MNYPRLRWANATPRIKIETLVTQRSLGRARQLASAPPTNSGVWLTNVHSNASPRLASSRIQPPPAELTAHWIA